MKKFPNSSYYNRPLFAHVVIGSLFIALASICLLTGFLPTHDAIEWHGAYHYFYSSVVRGVVPYWNPYSQTGTPFFTNFQSFGLLFPSQIFWILFQKITGCTTLTTWFLHYLLLYYLFIVGTYCTLRVITTDNLISLLFSIILFMGSFPTFMAQDGALKACFLIPGITFFLLLFFQESKRKIKGLYLFVTSFLCGILFNVYIPMFFFFYSLSFVALGLLFGVISLKATLRFLTSRSGLFWVGASLILVLLLSLPVLALYYELSHESEQFPSVRFLQATMNNLVQGYVSDLHEDLFSEEFTKNIKTSLTLGNLSGFLLEPFQRFFYGFPSSEVALYISILPLICIWIALRRGKNRHIWFFLAIAGFLLLISCNFKTRIYDQPSINQHIMLVLFPVLKMSDVLQNSGPLILFCFIIVSAIGFQKLLIEDGRKVFWTIPILFLFYKYIVFLPLVLGYESAYYIHHNLNIRLIEALQFIVQYVYQNLFLWSILFIFALFLIVSTKEMIINTLSTLSVRRSRHAAFIILFLDLVLFDGIYIVYVNSVLKQNYYDYLRQENLLHTKSESAFINYRVPFSFRDVESYKTPDYKIYDAGRKRTFNSFFGHEIYNVKKVAFPSVVEFMQSMKSGENFFTFWDHFYMTTYYYDYLVNIKYDKQLVTSHIISPILNFFPKENAIFVENKYEAVKRMNQSSLSELRTHIFIEQNRAVQAQALDVSQFFNPDNYVTYTQEEIANFDKNLGVQYPGNPDVQINIVDYDINHLSLNVETPYDGYLYFGDGYSKHWKAFVDGKPTTIEKTNINFKSVYTPQGKHRVAFVFDPVLYRYSLYAYFAGILLFCAIGTVFLTRRRKKLRS